MVDPPDDEVAAAAPAGSKIQLLELDPLSDPARPDDDPGRNPSAAAEFRSAVERPNNAEEVRLLPGGFLLVPKARPVVATEDRVEIASSALE